MSVDLARTFLEITRCGSFVGAAERLHLTQTAVTARIQSLESQLNCSLFVRNRSGAKLTPNGEAFVDFANRMVLAWEAAQQELPLPDDCAEILHIGAEPSLCNPLMLRWVCALRQTMNKHAVHSHIGEGSNLVHRLEQGGLDAVLVYQPLYWPGMQVELLMEERLVQVTDDESKATALRLMQEEGILCGISCGSAMAAALKLAQEPEMQGKTLVVILPDSGERYLSSMLFDGLFSEQELQQ